MVGVHDTCIEWIQDTECLGEPQCGLCWSVAPRAAPQPKGASEFFQWLFLASYWYHLGDSLGRLAWFYHLIPSFPGGTHQSPNFSTLEQSTSRRPIGKSSPPTGRWIWVHSRVWFPLHGLGLKHFMGLFRVFPISPSISGCSKFRLLKNLSFLSLLRAERSLTLSSL